MPNAVKVTDGGKDPAPQRDGTETFQDGIYWKGIRSIGVVSGCPSQIQEQSSDGGLLRTCCMLPLVRGLVRAPCVCTSDWVL